MSKLKAAEQMNKRTAIFVFGFKEMLQAMNATFSPDNIKEVFSQFVEYASKVYEREDDGRFFGQCRMVRTMTPTCTMMAKGGAELEFG
jgi:hypothetical protein